MMTSQREKNTIIVATKHQKHSFDLNISTVAQKVSKESICHEDILNEVLFFFLPNVVLRVFLVAFIWGWVVITQLKEDTQIHYIKHAFQLAYSTYGI